MPTSRAQTALAVPLWILAAIATVFFLRATRTVLVPIALSLLAAVALYPVVLWLERAKIPRTLGAALIVLTIAGLGALGAWSLKDDFASTVRTLPAQIRDVREKIERQSRSSTVSGLQQSVAELRKTAESGSLGGAAGPQSSGASGGADSAAQPSALQ